jgi:hypothetical protein
MKPLRSIVWACVLGTVAVGAGPVQAGWNNVFQVTCFHCRRQPVAVSNYTPVVVSNAAPNPCCNPCPQVCTTQYIQRCYYQPVTTYETRSYYEPVTTYRTSYYYEPVTSYRYVSYYDPCSCSCQQVAVATTSYQLRSQCCPVQSWVQRCYQVAVTNYRQVSYYEPVTTCSNPCPPPCAAPAPAPAVTTSPPPPSVSTSQPPYATQPGVTEQRGTTAPGANGTSGSPLFDQRYDQRNYQPPTNPMPPASGTLRPVPQQLPVRTPPAVRLDRITAVPNPTLEGQVVTRENRPRGGVPLVLVSALKESHRRPVMTDATGNFQVHLPPGEWLVYTPGTDGKPVLLSKVEVGDHETRKMTLVSK